MDSFKVGDKVFFGRTERETNPYGLGEILRIRSSIGGMDQYIVSWENKDASPHLGQYLRLATPGQSTSANERIKVLLPDSENDLGMPEFLMFARKRETICQDIQKLEEHLKILKSQKDFNQKTVLYSDPECSVYCGTRDNNVVLVQKTKDGITNTITVSPSIFENILQRLKND